MKKIFVILLVFTCMFTMFSCGDGDADGKATLKDFADAVNNTKPTVVEVNIEAETPLGELTSSIKTVYSEDGSFVMEYSREKFVGLDATEDVKTVEKGTVSCDANGNYSDGGAFVGATAAAQGPKLNLDEEKITYSISGDGAVLTATVAAANTKDVVGIEFASDVTLIVTVANEKVISTTVSYESVVITTTYQ